MAIIYLIGYRGTGKTTVGQRLAQRLGYAFYDLDACLCEQYGMSVANLVARHGWEEFRRREMALLRQITAEAGDNAVLATGGGIILQEENRQFMGDHGVVFWLRAPEQVICQRLAAVPEHGQRPSLTGQGLLAEISAVLEERLPLYEACAHHCIDAAGSISDVCDEVCAKLRESGCAPS